MSVNNLLNNQYSPLSLKQLDEINYAGSLGLSSLQFLIDYIERHLEENITLSQMAAMLNFSQAYLSQRFKEETGIPLHQYIIRRRVQRAKQLLQCSNLSLTDIALRCGFCSHSHLSRCFRRIEGIPPSAFRLGIDGNTPTPEWDYSMQFG